MTTTIDLDVERRWKTFMRHVRRCSVCKHPSAPLCERGAELRDGWAAAEKGRRA